MYFYMAGRYSRRQEFARYAAQLCDAGHTTTARWLKGDHDEDDQTLWLRYADEDLLDISQAEIFILFTEPDGTPTRRGGRFVEFGYALAKGLTIIRIGPAENIFLSKVRKQDCYPDWDAFIDALVIA